MTLQELTDIINTARASWAVAQSAVQARDDLLNQLTAAEEAVTATYQTASADKTAAEQALAQYITDVVQQ